ncbi:hypothetical protein ACW5R3_13405 [Bizionia sp. KMM 8389]
MKILKSTILATVFLFGLTAMSDSSKSKVNEEFENFKNKNKLPVKCATVFTVCDRAFPNNYVLFNTCMTNNGC